MDGARVQMVERIVAGSDGCEDQPNVGADLPHFSDVAVDSAAATNLGVYDAHIAPAPGESRLELGHSPNAHQDSTSIEAAKAAKAPGQSPQPTHLYAPTVDSVAAAPASSSDNPVCTNCRMSKVKCDRFYPCGRCKRRNLTCVFQPIETKQKNKHRRKRGSRDTASKICGGMSFLQIEAPSRQLPASPNMSQPQRPTITSMKYDLSGRHFGGKATAPSHFEHPQLATAELKRNSENAWDGTRTTALHVPGHDLLEGSFQGICANKPQQEIAGRNRPQHELERVSGNGVLNSSTTSRAWPSQYAGEPSGHFQTQSRSHGFDEKEAISADALPYVSSVVMIESTATTWCSEKSHITQRRGNFPFEDSKFDGVNSIYISVDNSESNSQSLRAAGIAGKKILSHASELGNDSVNDLLAPELALPENQDERGFVQPASSSLSEPIDAIDFGDKRMSTTPRRAYLDCQVNSRSHRDITAVSQLGVRVVDVKGAEVSHGAGMVPNTQGCDLQLPETRPSVDVVASVEDWSRTGPHRLLNSWLELMQRVIYNQERAVRTLIHLAQTAIASRRPDLLQHVLFLLKQNGRKFDACSTLREVEYRKKIAPSQEAHSKDACVFPLRLNGVDMHACLIIYLTVYYGVIQVCDANDVFKENVMDSTVNDESVFDILARIFSGDDLLLCYDAMVELYCGVSSEISLMLNYNKNVGKASGWMKDKATKASTQVRIRYEISDDGNYAKYDRFGMSVDINWNDKWIATGFCIHLEAEVEKLHIVSSMRTTKKGKQSGVVHIAGRVANQPNYGSPQP